MHEVFLGALRDLDGFQGDDEHAFKAFITAIVRHRLLQAPTPLGSQAVLHVRPERWDHLP